MAEDQTTGTTPEGAERRLTEERDTAQTALTAAEAKVGELEGQVQSLGNMRHIETWVRSKGVSDATIVNRWVDTIMPSFATVDYDSVDKIPELLEGKFGTLVTQPTAPPTTDTTADPAREGVTTATPPVADPASAPGFAQPNPATAGAPPDGETRYKYSDPYIQNLVKTNRKDELEALNKAGRIEWTARSQRFGDDKIVAGR